MSGLKTGALKRWAQKTWNSRQLRRGGAIVVIAGVLVGIGANHYLAGHVVPAAAQTAGSAGPPARDQAFGGPDSITSPQQALDWVRLQRSLDETDDQLFWGGLPPPSLQAASALRVRLYALLDQTLTSLVASQKTGSRPAVDHAAWRQLFADLRKYFTATPPSLIAGPAADGEVNDALRNAENAVADLPAR